MKIAPPTRLEKSTTTSDAAIRKVFFLMLGLASVFYAFHIWHDSFVVAGERFFSLFDDAMIAMCYGRNLADGHGLCWTVGEPPVEGYTNFLWTLFMALVHLLPITTSKTSLVVMATGAGILVANLFVVKSIAEKLVPENRLASLVVVFFTAFYYPLIYWTLSGMEVGFLTLLISLSVLLVLRLERQWSPGEFLLLTVMAVASILTRMDAVIPIGILTLFAFITGWKQGVRGGLLILPFSLLAVMAAQTAFRMHYYGDFLPNTYYLKLSGVSLFDRVSRGINVLAQAILFHFWPLLLLLAAGFLRRARQFFNFQCLLLLGLIAGQAGYSVYVGGDSWKWSLFANRYVTIITPLLFVMTVRALALLAPDDGLLLCRFLGLGLLAEAWLLLHFHRGVKLDACILAALALLVVLGGVVLALPAFRTRRARWSMLAPILCTAVVINFFGYSGWAMGERTGGLAKMEMDKSREGLLFKKIFPPDFTLAVLWAGAPPYFSELRCIDLLGKCDSVVAKGKRCGPFYPGHDKWDYTYSIGKYQPDVIMELQEPTEDDIAMIRAAGYIKTEGGMWIKKASAPRIKGEMKWAE